MPRPAVLSVLLCVLLLRTVANPTLAELHLQLQRLIDESGLTVAVAVPSIQVPQVKHVSA